MFENTPIEAESAADATSSNSLCDSAYSLAQATPGNDRAIVFDTGQSLTSGSSIELPESESLSSGAENPMVPELLGSDARLNLFSRALDPENKEKDDLTIGKTEEIERSLEPPLISRADIERYLNRTSSNGFGSGLKIFDFTRQSAPQEPEWSNDYLYGLDSKYVLPDNAVEKNPVYEFGKLRIPAQQSNGLPKDRYLPGKTDGRLAPLEFQTDMETIAERIDGIGKFNFKTRKGKNIELSVLRDCGPGDYGICIKMDR